MFIFAALRKKVQLVLDESVCAVRTQSELSGSPALLVSAHLYTQTVFTQTILRHRAATNDYFDNRLVGRLLFRLIGLNQIMLFIDKIHTIPHSAQCPSNTPNAMKTYSASFIKPPVIKRKQIF